MDSFFSTELYKRTQGRIVRQTTAAVVFIILMGLVYSVAMSMNNFAPKLITNRLSEETAEIVLVTLRSLIPILMTLVFAWFSFRLVHIHRFADFLIHVEAEMRKVSWPSRPELIRSVGVVIFVMFSLAIILFLFDLGITTMFAWIGTGMKMLFIKIGIFSA